jgi:predicted RNase H-like nuclease (RuvC/YqgF family)
MSLHQKIKNLIVKATKLVEQNQKLAAKNEGLEVEIKALKRSLEEEAKKVTELHNQIKIIKLARNIGSENGEGTDVTELKRKINEYIKEIDHCVAMLND